MNRVYFPPEWVSYNPIDEKGNRNVIDVKKIDVWSLGVTFVQLIFDRIPFVIKKEKDGTKRNIRQDEFGAFLQNITDECVEKEFNDDDYKGIDDTLLDFLLSFLKVDPDKRLLPSDLLNHKFFNNLPQVFRIVSVNFESFAENVLLVFFESTIEEILCSFVQCKKSKSIKKEDVSGFQVKYGEDFVNITTNKQVKEIINDNCTIKVLFKNTNREKKM